MGEIQNATDPGQAVTALDAARPRFTFKVPETARMANDPHEITVRAITVGQESMANQAAEAPGVSVVYELLKHSIYAADGKPVLWDADSKDRFIESCSPKVRQLLMEAYKKVCMPSGKERDDFLSSMTVAVG